MPSGDAGKCAELAWSFHDSPNTSTERVRVPLSTVQRVLGAIEARSRRRRAEHTDAILLLPERAPAARALDRSAVLNIVVVLWKLSVGWGRFHSDGADGGSGEGVEWVVVMARFEELSRSKLVRAGAKPAGPSVT